jgi:hypothetical protein
MFDSMAKLLILMGAILIIIGGVFLLAPKLPFLGRLPGDIAFRRGNWSFYFPLTTSILLSLLLTVLFNLFGRR